jgi:hypothetical protein
VIPSIVIVLITLAIITELKALFVNAGKYMILL